jgi:hypothetical protein
LEFGSYIMIFLSSPLCYFYYIRQLYGPANITQATLGGSAGTGPPGPLALGRGRFGRRGRASGFSISQAITCQQVADKYVHTIHSTDQNDKVSFKLELVY